MKIASVFYNQTEEGKEYYNVKFDDTFLELNPNLKNLKFSMREIPLETRKENGPVFEISSFLPKPKTE